MKKKSKKPKQKPTKKKKVSLMLESMTPEEIENFQFEIRKYLLAKGARQVNGFRFEYASKRFGKIRVERFDLLRRAMTVHVQTTNWKRKGKYGNPDPYRWEISSVGFYREIVIKKSEQMVFNESRGTHELVTEYKSLYYPNALNSSK